MTLSSRSSLLGLVACSALVAVLGCTNRIGDLTLVSTRNIDLSQVSLDVRKGKRVEGEDCSYALLGIIPLGLPTLEGAVDDALEKGGGNVMIDQVTYDSFLYFILASRRCIRAEGTVLDSRGS